MKKFILLGILVLIAGFLYAQEVKIAYIEPNRILEGCVIGKKAMSEMNTLIKEWENKYDTMEQAYKEKIEEFQTPIEDAPITMTDAKKEEFKKEQEDIKKALLEEIQEMEVDMMKYDRSINGTPEKGGADGLLIMKQQEILNPVLEKIEAVSTKYAIKNNFVMLLQDNPSNVTAYLDPEFNISDITDDIIVEMDKLAKE